MFLSSFELSTETTDYAFFSTSLTFSENFYILHSLNKSLTKDSFVMLHQLFIYIYTGTLVDHAAMQTSHKKWHDTACPKINQYFYIWSRYYIPNDLFICQMVLKTSCPHLFIKSPYIQVERGSNSLSMD